MRAHLAAFGLEGQKALTRIEQLSGGEKARLLFAVIAHTKPNLLILDEPTNHLDIDAREALVDALNTYTGAVILITHDLNLIEMVADRLWLVANGTCTPYLDDIESYQKMLLDAQKTPSNLPKKENHIALTPKEKRQQQAAKLQAMQPIKNQIKSLENKMQSANERIATIEQMFMQTLTPQQMVDLQKELSTLNKELQNDESLWLELNEKLESF